MSSTTTQSVTNPSFEQAKDLTNNDEIIIEHTDTRKVTTISEIEEQSEMRCAFVLTCQEDSEYKFTIDEYGSQFWKNVAN